MNQHLSRHRLPKAGTPAPTAPAATSPLLMDSSIGRQHAYDAEKKAAALKAARGELEPRHIEVDHSRSFEWIMAAFAITALLLAVGFGVWKWLI